MKLSPFVVETEKDTGYIAADTLNAGSPHIAATADGDAEVLNFVAPRRRPTRKPLGRQIELRYR